MQYLVQYLLNQYTSKQVTKKMAEAKTEATQLFTVNNKNKFALPNKT